MINSLPFLGWALSLAFNISLALPFWLCWTVFGIGARYFYFVPTIYQRLPFWHCVGLFIVISILKGCFPTLVSVSQTNKKETK